jgi:23S rRNA pseudouridine2605 synthase
MSDIISFPIRLQSYLAKCGLGSRRGCEKLITDGLVEINGQVVTELGVKVNEHDDVRCKNKDVHPFKPVYIMLNKPEGFLASNYDPHYDTYAIDLINVPEKSSLFHVGRLDKESSGLMIYTNDGKLAQKLTHPSFEIEKEYMVETLQAEKFLRNSAMLSGEGLEVEGILYRFKDIKSAGKNLLSVTLTEGKNREIRNVFRYLGCSISRLHRIRIGNLLLGNLETGSFRKISRDEAYALTLGEHTL